MKYNKSLFLALMTAAFFGAVFFIKVSSTVAADQPCQLTGTAWNMTTASKGDTVEFHVIGNNCDGEAVNVRIMEDDLIDVPAQVQPTNIYINGNTVTKTWVAETGDAVGKSEYYTEAWLPSDTQKQNMLTSSNKLVVSQNDTTPPLTSAYHAGGSYPSTTSVALNCNDFTGSGCAKTYYTTNNSEPTVNSAVYASELEISSATTLKFFSVDTLGNTEAIKTEKYVIVPEQDSPIGHWKFDEESGDTALDAAGNNNGAITGATRTAGKIGGALSFGPSGDRVVLGNEPSLKVFPSPKWSFAAWINPTGEGDPWQTIFNGIWHKPWINYTPYPPEPDTDDGKGNGVGFGFFPKKVETLSGSFLWRTRSATNVVMPNQWNHVAVTSDGVNHKLFVNGALVGTAPYLEISDIDHSHFRTHGGYIIGNIVEFDAPQSSFSGRIDDVRIYNKPLSESEINALAQPDFDTTDLSIFQSCWWKDTTVTTECTKADFDGDSFVGPADYNMLKDAITKYDLNGDGSVDVSTASKGTDQGIFQSCWWKDTTVTTECAKADFDGDSFVGPADFNMLKDDLAKYDLNGDGMLTGGTTPINFIQVNSPNGGDLYSVGQTQRISWNAAGVAKVKIYIYDDRVAGSGSTMQLTPNNEPISAVDGYFDWLINKVDLPTPPVGAKGDHYKIRIDGFDNAGMGIDAAVDSSDNYFVVEDSETKKNPISRWKFDEESGSTTVDSIGSNNGTIVGAQRTAEGVEGKALSFGANNNYVQIPNSASMNVFPRKNWSFTSWIKPTGKGDRNQTIFNGIWHVPWISYSPFEAEPDSGDHPINSVGFGFFESLSERFRWKITSAANKITPNQWNHVGVTSDGINYTLYVNGAVVGSSPYVGISTNVNPAGGLDVYGFRIGNTIESYNPSESFVGLIDDVRIYDQPLTQTEMATLADEFAFHPADVNHDGKINIKDIQAIIREIVGKTEICITLADFRCPMDINKDGKVNIRDIQGIIREIVNPS